MEEPGGAYRIVKSGCFLCHGGCGIIVHVRGGRAIRVEGDPDHPNSRGYLCVKGQAGIELLYHKERLLHPLRRAGARGEGKWERISWDEALDTCAAELQKVIDRHGPLAVTGGDGTKADEVAWIVDLFLLNLGSTNRTGPGRAQCMLPRRAASNATFGNYYSPDYEGDPKLIVLWGDQPEITNHNSILGYKMIEKSRQGAKLIVIDPRRTAAARRADIWLPIRPGTDAALALSMMHVMIEENLYDREFVEKWTNAPLLVDVQSGDLLRGAGGGYLAWDKEKLLAVPGDLPGAQPALCGAFDVGGRVCKTVWQLLKERCAEYTPPKAAAITWLDPGDIVRAARLYAATKPAALAWGVGLDMCVNAHQNGRACTLLECLTGNVDVPGGNMHPVPSHKGCRTFTDAFGETLPREAYVKQLGAERFRLCAGPTTMRYANNPAVLKAILTGEPYPVRAWVAVGGNPLLTWSNAKEVYRALMKLDFFMGVDLFMNPSLQLADIVLPAPTHFEKERLMETHGYGPFGNVRCVRAVEPLGEVRDEFEVCGDILRRMGMDRNWPWRTVVDFYDERLREAGMTWREAVEAGGAFDRVAYRKHETGHYRQGGGFPTATGKAELWSTVWRRNGYDPLPDYTEVPESPYSDPGLMEKYPFVVITGGRLPGYFHSQQRQVETLRRLHPDPQTQIHPEAAARLGIRNGDWVCVESPRGRCVQRARLFAGMDPRLVHVEHGWWFPEEEGAVPHLYGAFRSNANTLTPNADPFLDPAFGGYTLRGFAGRVYKVSEEEAQRIGWEEALEARMGVS
ncbi:MAG: molybdopterin-dependent oxidoreductase [Candidatus Tectomicrobia bacterium]|uniref:Molybdopterin-dependent oxidoreductase n=1 Tax=Tectimicrobiota bacterium TaxID=2528274 RepID=A0A932I408_UNCTE|nr:molybdopterin-dependent oxidoreductase [Candidatus Tectomicrobia bacterium]